MSVARRIRRFLAPVVRRTRALHKFYRLKMALSYFRNPLRQVLVWLMRSNEDANFTYDLPKSVGAEGG